jgi:alanyl-tRNA synthetase
MDAQQLRRAFTGFFVDRGHTLVPSMGLIPHHPAAPMFANAGMNQFLPVILGEEPVPRPPRATSVQKCLRVKGKHDDIANVGVTWGHCTFFEMLGNFSFGDYFKAEVIPWAWELLTEVLEIDGDRLWITVHESDHEAASIWRDCVGVPAARIQAMGPDNFWEMGETGPCGPCSEIYYDRGEAHGAPGGPAQGGEERFREIWNLVFMQYNRHADGALEPLPLRIIDTGAGLERMLTVLQGVNSVFETDELSRLVTAAEAATGRLLGEDPKADISLRVLVDHARTVTFMVADGQTPSNEDRGYVLRRILRRAVRHAFGLGVEGPVLAAMVEAVVDVMGPAYPELVAARADLVTVIGREEERFHRTLRSGMALLDEELAELEVGGTLPGAVAFRLHDTYGFPFELTVEVAQERGFSVDAVGFEEAMRAQQVRGRDAARGTDSAAGLDKGVYKTLLEEGPVEFTGYSEQVTTARVRRVIGDEIFLDRTPFYAEGGGQVGDTGTLVGPTGRAEVLDTTYALPGLHRHSVRMVDGEITEGQVVTAAVDTGRRQAIRRNHTGTHLLHWALREVLGSHVKQAGSLVAPERLRFDFSHFEAVSPEELERVEALANQQVLANEPVKAYEVSKAEAERLGAIAFFGDKYGDVVRVVEAGPRSVELCGGTHVHALGTIGPIKITSESSIGANLRRIEAVTGTASLDRIRDEEHTLSRAATLLRVTPPEVPERVERLLDEARTLTDEVKALRRQGAGGRARELAAGAVDGVVVTRIDGTTRDELKDLAVAIRDQPGVRGAVLGGVPEGGGVTLVAAVAKGSGLDASKLIAEAARTVGGGGGRGADVAVAGGRNAEKLDEALDQARVAAGGTGAG